ncbi:MAG: hypothetical protein ACRC1P_07160 [Cellulosilyticaceae bacterium]
MHHKWISIILIVSLSLVGCSVDTQEANSLKVEQILSQEVTEINQDPQRQSTSINVEELSDFFRIYFELSQEQRLLLNQDPLNLEGAEQEHYKEQVSAFQKVVGVYLEEKSSERLAEGDLGSSFHVPKILEMNKYVTIGESEVEAVNIQSMRPLGENIIYEVDVVTREKVISSIEANKLYTWDEGKRYYRMREAHETITNSFEDTAYLGEELSQSYLFLQETPDELVDTIRLVHSYWVEVAPGENLKIVTLEEATPFAIGVNDRQKASSHKYVDRIPYEKEVSQSSRERIKKVLTTLMCQPKDFFEKYKKIIYTSAEQVEETFEGIGLEEEIIVPQVGYRNAYSANLDPYKDSIKKIKLADKGMKITPSIFSTQKQPRYQVEVLFEGLCQDNQLKYYKTEYLIGFEQEKIEFIHFISAKQIPLEQYRKLSIE